MHLKRCKIAIIALKTYVYVYVCARERVQNVSLSGRKYNFNCGKRERIMQMHMQKRDKYIDCSNTPAVANCSHQNLIASIQMRLGLLAL